MAGAAAFEAMQFVEPTFGPGEAFPRTVETRLGVFDSEVEAIRAARAAWQAHRAANTNDVAWWIVRHPGETLATWIADSRSPTERVLDLRTNRLVEAD